MMSMADFGPTRVSDQLRARDPRRKKIILESQSTKSSLSTSDIAVEAGCTSGYVCRILKAKAKEEQPSGPAQATETGAPHEVPEKYESWFQSVIETHFSDFKAALCTSVRETPEQTRWTTNLKEPSCIRHITKPELKANTFPYNLNSTDENERKRGTEWLRHHFSGKKKSSQGFVIMDAHTDSNGKPSTALFDELPKLLDKEQYAKELKPIFQRLQDKKEDKTKGDGKRRQAKMTELARKAILRVREAEILLRRKANSTKGSAKKKKTAGGDGYKKKKKRVSIHYPTTKEEAEQTLKDVREEYRLINEAIRQMSLGYDRIYQVAPVDQALTFPPRHDDTCIAGVASKSRHAEGCSLN